MYSKGTGIVKRNGSETRGHHSLSVVLALVMAVTLLAGIPAGDISKVQAETTPQNPTRYNGKVTWDCVYFGSYPQTDATGQKKDPIKWRVLSVDPDKDDMFLMADVNLDARTYNDNRAIVTWENSTMRSWLNGYGSDSNVSKKDYTSDNFIQKAFTAEEQAVILPTVLENKSYYDYIEDGNPTEDKVFLLSYYDVNNWSYGFSGDKTRLRRNTAYASEQSKGSLNWGVPGNGGWWWLRTTGQDYDWAMDVNFYGGVDQYGCYVYYRSLNGTYRGAVCPALHVKLSASDCWSYAGTVSEDTITVSGEKYTVPEDSNTETVLSNPRKNEEDAVTWDCVYFGNYPQSDASGAKKEPIKWRVLSVDENDAFLVADVNLDVEKYDEKGIATSWQMCTLRSWLNGYGSDSNRCNIDYQSDNFIDKAFTSEEQDAIRTTRIEGRSYSVEDKISLLSDVEAVDPSYGFSPNNEDEASYNKERLRRNTAYAAAQIAAIDSVSKPVGRVVGNSGDWWLRSTYVNSYGSITGSLFQTVRWNAVCPTLHLDLSHSDVWTYVGTVSMQADNVASNPPEDDPDIVPSEETTEEITEDILSEQITKEPEEEDPEDPENVTKDPEGQEAGPAVIDSGSNLLAVGTILTLSTGTYKVKTSTALKKEVIFVKPKSKKKASVTIPASVPVGGMTYKVTEIAPKAFKNNKKLKSVTIGKNVAKIGKEAFYGCKKLKKITIKSSALTSIGKNAIKNIQKSATIKVPRKKLGKYRKLFTKKTGYKKSMKIKK